MIASTRPRKLVHDRPRGLAGDPAAVASARGQLAVERHGPLGDDPGPAGSTSLRYGALSSPGFGFEQADFDLDARGLQFGDAAAGDLRETDRAGRRRRGARRRRSRPRLQGGVLP